MGCPLKFCKKCYLGHKIETRGGAIDNVTKIRKGWIKFNDLVPLLARRDLEKKTD